MLVVFALFVTVSEILAVELWPWHLEWPRSPSNVHISYLLQFTRYSQWKRDWLWPLRQAMTFTAGHDLYVRPWPLRQAMTFTPGHDLYVRSWPLRQAMTYTWGHDLYVRPRHLRQAKSNVNMPIVSHCRSIYLMSIVMLHLCYRLQDICCRNMNIDL